MLNNHFLVCLLTVIKFYNHMHHKLNFAMILSINKKLGDANVDLCILLQSIRATAQDLVSDVMKDILHTSSASSTDSHQSKGASGGLPLTQLDIGNKLMRNTAVEKGWPLCK